MNLILKIKNINVFHNFIKNNSNIYFNKTFIHLIVMKSFFV